MKKQFEEAILEILSLEDVITTSDANIEHDYADPFDWGNDVTVTVRRGE
jgi:hypothetical protein